MATATHALTSNYPLGSRISPTGRLEVGGCDTLELARTFGTPAYVVAEDDLRARARAYLDAGRAAHPDGPLEVVFASKAFPAKAILQLFVEEGLGVDVASGGELFLALRAGCPPERLVLHGNAKSEAELQAALHAGVGRIVVDNADELERLVRLASRPQRVLLRVAPDIRGDTHASISTGQADTKFGFSLAEAPAAIDRVLAVEHLQLEGLHVHIGSQLAALEPFRRAARALAPLGTFAAYDLGGGLGTPYLADQALPDIADFVAAQVAAAHDELDARGRTLILEPGRSLTAVGGVTLYTVESVKENVARWVSVDGGMSDNLRPMLYGAPYEAAIADRMDQPGTPCRVAGKHCESGDVIVRDASLPEPRAGDVVVTPGTGAYGHAMANNYNGVPRPPVVLCRDGDARVVVRRESLEDLAARDVP